MAWERIAENRIREAMQAGEFDNLPGAGKPVDLEGYFKLPEHLRVAFSILKNANCVPAEVELLNEIATLEQQLDAAPEDGKRAIRRMLTDRDTQLAVVHGCARPARVTRRRQPHRANEPAVAPLDQMEVRIASRPARTLVAGDEDGSPFGDDADSVRRDARKVDADFECFVGLVHVEGSDAFTGECFRTFTPLEIAKHPPDLIPELNRFGRQDDRFDPRTHP